MQYRLTEDERHAAFQDAQYRAYRAALESERRTISHADGGVYDAATAVQRQREAARTWAEVANALRKDRV